MHEVLINRLGGLSLPRKSVDWLTDRPDMTLDVYCGRKTTIQQQHINRVFASDSNQQSYDPGYFVIGYTVLISGSFRKGIKFQLPAQSSQNLLY